MNESKELTKEVRIGVLVAVSLIIFFIGFYFLKGANLFSNDKKYYCYYNDVGGLQSSASVVIRGVTVGHVAGMELIPGKSVRVTLSLQKGVKIPGGTIASLAPQDLLGTQIIKLEPGKGPGLLKPGDTLPTTIEGGVVDNVSEELTPRLRELKSTIIALDTALAGVSAIVSGQNQRAIAATIQSLKTTSDNFAKLSGALSGETGELSTIIHNTSSITGNLAKQNDTIQHILANVNNITRQMARSPIQKTLAGLQETASQLQGIVTKINNKEGSLGMLINDKEAYNNLNTSLVSLHNLMDDIKAHPGRYINVTIFGKKQKP